MSKARHTTHTPPPGAEEQLVAFVQKVAAQRRAICKADHHAATCRGAVGLAEEAGKLLGGLGIEPRYPQDPFGEPCALCGGSEYVLGEIWTRAHVHVRCLPLVPHARRIGNR